jgi:hypothetical protein
MSWIDNDPTRPDNSTLNVIDIRHSQIVEYDELGEYDPKPFTCIRHILALSKQRFMPTLHSNGRFKNGDQHIEIYSAKQELDEMVKSWIKEMDAVKEIGNHLLKDS